MDAGGHSNDHDSDIGDDSIMVRNFYFNTIDKVDFIILKFIQNLACELTIFKNQLAYQLALSIFDCDQHLDKTLMFVFISHRETFCKYIFTQVSISFMEKTRFYII